MNALIRFFVWPGTQPSHRRKKVGECEHELQCWFEIIPDSLINIAS
jgi:hypothetical protein